MSYLQCNCFEKKLAFHTAPSLLGIKPASLFSVYKHELNNKNILEFNRMAVSKGLKLRKICVCRNRILLMLYNESKLEKQLHRPECITLLERYGYSSEMMTEEMIERLSLRIMKTSDFPHEIGIFLGYPIEDVNGFIENNGRNFKLCGYWKVYGDKVKAEKTFNNYNKCRNYLCNRLDQGDNFYHILKII